ncbi:MAG: hypothetical protein ACE5IB_03520 [Candidatus Geothermarchaeales archaeon]
MVTLERAFETLLPLVVAVLALIPLIILAITYRRTGSRRVLLAALAFAFFVGKGVLLGVTFFIGSMSFETLELIEFGSDFLIVLLFASSFLGSYRE